MKKFLLISLFIIFSITAILGRKVQYKQYNVDEGLLQSYVKGICQLPNHEIGLLTASGLCFFDGVKFTTPKDSLFDSYITTIATIDSSLWIGTFSDGIYIWEGEDKIKQIRNNSFLPNFRINQLEKKNGILYIATAKGLVVASDKDTIIYDMDKGLFSSIVINFDVDEEGNIWLTTIKGFSVITKEKKVINVTDDKFFKNSFCETIKADRYGNVWVGTREGLLVFNKNIFLEKGALTNPSWFYKGQIPVDFITKITEDKFGDLWIGTKRGIIKYEYTLNNSIEKTKVNKNYFNYFSIDNLFIKDIFVDIEHNIWLGTRGGGAIKIQGDIFWTYGLNDGLLNREILSIYQTKDKSVWFGTNDGFAKLKNNKIKTYSLGQGLHNKIITDFYETDYGSTLIGTWDGLAIYKNGRILNVGNKNLNFRFRVFDIKKKSKNEYWLATNMGLIVYNLRSNNYRVVEKYPQLFKKRINTIYVRNDSLVYFVCNSNLFQLNTIQDTLISLNKKYNIQSDFFTAMAYSEKIGTLIGCRHGIYVVKKDSVVLHLNSKKHLIDDWVISIVVVGENKFWIGGNKGVSLLTINENLDVFVKNYSSKNGFIGEEIITENSMFMDRDENVWFGTFLGVSKYIKEKDIINSVPPPVKIEKVKVFYAETAPKSLQNLKYDQNTISVDFIGVSFRDERDVVYKYRLIGESNEWSEVTSSRVANFHNLKSGNYTFEVIARNKDGFWSSEPASTQLRIMKPFWQTRLFLSIIILGIIFVVYMFFRSRITKINKEKKNLELKVQERTKTLIEQQKQLLKNNEELENLTDDLRKSMNKLQEAQLHLVQSEKMASLGTLIAGVMHELNNPVTFIYSNFNSLKDYLDSILRVLQSAKSECMTNNEKLVELYSKEDMDYILDDLPHLLNGIEYGTNRIKDIVMQLYRFSHPGQSIEKVNVNDNLELTLGLFLNQYKRQISVHKNFNELPVVDVPGGELNQVFLNILVNSAHAIINVKKSGNIWINTFLEDEFTVVTIKDEGGGIPKNIMDKIFDPFFTTKPIGKGTGMGLSLSYNIMKKMGGDISFDNTDEGVMFSIYIPKVAEIVEEEE